MTNLAQILDLKGDLAGSEKALLQALSINPNYEPAFALLTGTYDEHRGAAERDNMVQRLAKNTRDWRAKLDIAGRAARERRIDDALAIYRPLLKTFPAEPYVLMAVSGDLGENGYLKEAETLVAPVYDPRVHGPVAGMNLLRVYSEMGEARKGQALVTWIRTLHRPDIEQDLDEFAAAFDDLR